ncbi:hypothetical protein P171DRAFT_444096 [Karstenula rhodostoma CBS 690.94]|uniref:Uncharacterized protein n=1 Tax=Karstenula rhodostoma CBS 690.94 TaxID=1392251 RepID=A0A9P4UDC0_9PLEO|nr:hypothetical protein P171DRAFT_444096 [Karstenula rhodostoma CBS 690.94]
MSTPREPSSSSLAENKIPRTHKTIVGTSQHPEYNVNKDLPHFKRGPNGKRLAPVSQFNSAAGRELAKGHSTMGSGSASQANLPNKTHDEDRTRPRNFSRTLPPTAPTLSDRDTLPSQNPLFGPYTVSHDTSSAFIATGHPEPIHVPTNRAQSAQKDEEKEQPCPLCNQTSTSLSPSQIFSHICPVCQRFVFRGPPPAHFGVTALQTARPLPPIPPRKNAPPPLKCGACVAVPGALVGEFRTVFGEGVCVICGELSGEGVAEVRSNGVYREGMSGELRGWFAGVVSQGWGGEGGGGGDGGGLGRSRSEPVRSAVATSVNASASAAGSLRRKGAVRRGASGRAGRP